VLYTIAATLVAVALISGILVAVQRHNDANDIAASVTSTTAPVTTAPEVGPPDGVPSTTVPSDPFGGGTTDALSQCATAIGSVLGSGLGGLGNGGSQPPTNEDVAAEIARLAKEDERVRDLDFTTVPTPEVVTPEELRTRVEADVQNSYPDAQAALDSRSLGALGAVPAGTDMKALQLQALGSQVAGFYDPDTKSIVVGAADPSQPLTPDGEITMAHELDHALTDQALGLPDAAENPQPGHDDTALAATGLVEGDATLVMLLAAIDGFGTGDPTAGLNALLGDPNALAGAQQDFDNLPTYVQRQLLFPYTDGLTFVCALFDNGGLDALDAAYDNPPTTSAQLMFPSRYFAGEGAVAPQPTPSPGPDWMQLSTREFGAAELEWLLAAPGGDANAALDSTRDRAGAWAGGSLTMYGRGADTAVGLSLVQHAGHTDLCDSMQTWATAAGLSASVVHCAGDHVGVGIAPDRATASLLAG
jgi:hypothetical protein